MNQAGEVLLPENASPPRALPQLKHMGRRLARPEIRYRNQDSVGMRLFGKDDCSH